MRSSVSSWDSSASPQQLHRRVGLTDKPEGDGGVGVGVGEGEEVAGAARGLGLQPLERESGRAAYPLAPRRPGNRVDQIPCGWRRAPQHVAGRNKLGSGRWDLNPRLPDSEGPELLPDCGWAA